LGHRSLQNPTSCIFCKENTLEFQPEWGMEEYRIDRNLQRHRAVFPRQHGFLDSIAAYLDSVSIIIVIIIVS